METDTRDREALLEALEKAGRREEALRLAVKLSGGATLTDSTVLLYDVELRRIQILHTDGEAALWQALDGQTPEYAIERGGVTGNGAVLLYDVFRSVERGQREGTLSFALWAAEGQRNVLCRYASLFNEKGAPVFGVILLADNTVQKRAEALELFSRQILERDKKRTKIMLINPENDMIEYESENGDISLTREGITHFQYAKDRLLSAGYVRPEDAERWLRFFDAARLIRHLGEEGFSDTLHYRGDSFLGRDRVFSVTMTGGMSVYSRGYRFCLHFRDITDEEGTPAGQILRSSSVLPQVEIRAFGHFEVFVDGRPISFQHSKAKEMLAALVDRRGGFMTTAELIGYLWEEEPSNKTTQSRCRQVASRLKRILEENGVGDILESVNGRRRVVAERVRCDYYDYLADKQKNRHLFSGSYMANYSWGEGTLVDLENEQ